MSRNNTIGIVGHIKTTPEKLLEAADWTREVYETTLIRTRPSGTEDTFFLRFDGRAVGTKEMLEKITEGAEVLVGGEIRSENVHNPQPEENRVKVYIFAEVIVVNNPPAQSQNEVTVCGYICQPPRFRSTRRRTAHGRRVTATNIMIAINTQTGTNYIPCVCFGWLAFKAASLNVGDYVEVYGRFQSRDYKKRIEGRKLPYLNTVHEVCAVRLDSESLKNTRTKTGKEEKADESNKRSAGSLQ